MYAPKRLGHTFTEIGYRFCRDPVPHHLNVLCEFIQTDLAPFGKTEDRDAQKCFFYHFSFCRHEFCHHPKHPLNYRMSYPVSLRFLSLLQWRFLWSQTLTKAGWKLVAFFAGFNVQQSHDLSLHMMGDTIAVGKVYLYFQLYNQWVSLFTKLGVWMTSPMSSPLEASMDYISSRILLLLPARAEMIPLPRRCSSAYKSNTNVSVHLHFSVMKTSFWGLNKWRNITDWNWTKNSRVTFQLFCSFHF